MNFHLFTFLLTVVGGLGFLVIGIKSRSSLDALIGFLFLCTAFLGLTPSTDPLFVYARFVVAICIVVVTLIKVKRKYFSAESKGETLSG